MAYGVEYSKKDRDEGDMIFFQIIEKSRIAAALFKMNTIQVYWI